MKMRRQREAEMVAQDKKSCMVFGMPREAIRVGAAEETCSLENISSAAIALLKRLRAT